MLEEATQILEETPNFASSVEVTGQLALAYLLSAREEEALSSAGKVLELMGKTSPTVYSMDIGFTAVAEVYFRSWEKALQDPDGNADVDKLKHLAEKSIKLLRAYQNVFPIGQAHTPYYQGWHAWLAGSSQKAVRLWKKSLEAAEKFNMPYEEGLARVRLGSAVTDDADRRREHLQRAIQIFERMGALHEMRSAQDEFQKSGL